MVFVIRFGFDSAVDLTHAVDRDFPDSQRHGCPLGAASDFALLFAAAQFAPDRDVTLRDRSGAVSQLSRRRRIDAAPLCVDFSRSGSEMPVLPENSYVFRFNKFR